MRIAILDDYQHVALTSANWDRVRAEHEITVFHDHIPDHEQDRLRERLLPFDIVCVMRERTPLRISLIERLPNLKLICSTAMGNSVIDIGKAAERGIVTCGCHGGGNGTVELTIGLMLALARGIVEQHLSVRAGGWQIGLGRELEGATLGVLGLGRIGPGVAKIGNAFDMKVIAWSQNMTREAAEAVGARLVTKEELFGTSDFLCVHLRLSDRTIGFVGAKELAMMKPDAFLINTSRGPIVDETALVEALRNRTIAGAGLDTFDEEPLPAGHPYLTAPRLVLTPHVGYVTREMYRLFYGGQVEVILAWLAGKPINVLGADNEVHRPLGT